MSRKIDPKPSVSISEEEKNIRNTVGGKLLFTDYKGRKGTFLFQNDRLTAVSFPEASRVGAIYIAKVKNVSRNIDACFVEIAEGEICFLPLKEAAFPFLLNRRFDGRIVAGDELPVQIARDAQKTKQAAATAQISLSNDYFVLTLGQSGIGFSAKLDKEQKAGLKYMLQAAAITENEGLAQDIFPDFPGQGSTHPDVMDHVAGKGSPALPVGLIVRTRSAEFLNSAVGDSQSEFPLKLPAEDSGASLSDTCSRTDLKVQFDSLAEAFQDIFQKASHRTCFSCLREPAGISTDPLNGLASEEEFEEIVTDDVRTFRRLQKYLEEHNLSGKTVRLYEETAISLSKLYGLDAKLEAALSQRVWLKSGGYLVIQPTEAMTVIDVNSGKYEAKRKEAEESAALRVNLEAAEEIALQLRLRNLSGIIVVDFINMEAEESRQTLMNRLRTFVRRDRTRTTVVDMTPLGLVEITRKKVAKPLYEQIYGKN